MKVFFTIMLTAGIVAFASAGNLAGASSHDNHATKSSGKTSSSIPSAAPELLVWCSAAIPVQCGDFLPYETTAAGAGNAINAYPGCSNGAFTGPEKVYVINKTTPGDLQVGIEIATPGLDLDLFLLADNCNQVTCLRSATSDNSQSNYEGLVLQDAPLGVYYIVVDGKTPNAQGQYRLEVACGYLDCSNAIPVNCGTPFSHTNLNGDDNAALYGCSGNINGGNSGPEVVHAFTITQPGWVNVSLTNLQANLDLFLLRSCDRDTCSFSSENQGTADEYISAFLTPGTYYAVVDGNNGAVSTYTLLVDCGFNCALAIANTSPSPATCGQSNGAITVVTTGGTAGYTVQYSGPLNGAINSNSGTIVIPGLGAGLYQLHITDAGGCTATQAVTVPSNSNMSVLTDSSPSICGNGGAARFTISNGVAPFTIQLSGPVSGTYNAGNNSIYLIDGLPPGNYTAVVRDALGCIVVRTFTVSHSSGNFSFNSTPNAASCNAPGSISIQTVGGPAPYTVSVSGPVSRTLASNTSLFTIPNLPGGTYLITLRSANNCTFSRTVVVPQTGMQMAAAPRSGACNQPGSISLQFTGGALPYHISWGGPTPGNATTFNTSYTITGLSSGVYAVQAIDATGCTAYQILHINNSAGPLAATFTAGGGACSATGSIAIQINNGNPQYTITWSGPVSGSAVTAASHYNISHLPGGTYLVQVTDATGCGRSGMVSVTTGAGLQVTPTVNHAACNQPGSVSLAISGGSAPYQIAWSGPVSGSATSNSSQYTISNLPGGVYTITVSAAGGCQSTQTVTINNTDSGNFSVVLMPLEASCQLCAAIWVDIYGGQAPYTVTWSGSSSGTLVTSQTNFDIYCVNAGTYTVVVTDANGCTTSATVTINQGPNSLHITATPTNADCAGGATGQVLLNISNGQPGYLVQWVGPVTGSYFSPVSLFSIYNLPPGNYNFTITDAEGCFLTIPVQIGTGFNLVVNPVPGPCGQPGSLSLSYSGGLPPYTITWNGPASGSTSTPNTTFNIANLPPGNYSVTVTSSDGCTDSKQATLIQTTNVVCTAVPVPGVCGANGSIHVGISSGTPGFTVTWTGPVSGSATTQNFFFNINNLPSGTYVITVTDANGCVCTHTVQLQNTGGNPTVSLTPVNGICGQPGSIGVHISGGVGPFQIVWTGPVSGSASTPNTAYVISNLPSGAYTVTVTGNNGCSGSATTVINNTGSQVGLNVTPVAGLCGANGSLWVDITGGTPPYQLMWTGPVSGMITLPVNGYNIPNLPSGSYTVTVTDVQGCTFTQVVILVNNTAVPDFTATPQPGVCGQPGSIALSITGSPGPYMVTWTGPVSGMVNNVPANYTIANLPSGTYTITVKDANHCTKTRTATLNNGTNLQITVVPVPNVCDQPGSIHIGMTGGTAPFSITWTGPSSGSATTGNSFFNINNLPSGTYTVSVTDATGCTRTLTVVLDNSANNVSINVSPVPGLCGANGSLWVNITGGTAPYNLMWMGPVSGSITIQVNGYSIPNLPSGTYTVKVTDAQGCMFQRTVTLTNNTAVPDFTATPQPGVCEQPGSISVQITGSPGPYMITWSGPVSGMVNNAPANYTLSNLPSGTYTITVKDPNLCTKTRTVTLDNSANNLQITAVAVPGICDQPGEINVGITGGTAPYTVVWSGPVNGSASTGNLSYNIPNLPSGTYTVTVTDVNGCTRTRTVVLNNSVNNLQITTTAVPGICGQPGQIQVSITGGTAPFAVVWTGPVNGSANTNNTSYTIPNLPSGTYTVTVTDANGCTRSQTRTVNNGPAITLTATGEDGICGQPGSIQLVMGGTPPPYSITWTGPVSGSATANGSNYLIANLPSGTYTVTASTGPDCNATQTVILDNGQVFGMTVTPVPGICVQTGSIMISFTGGVPPIAITWSGPVNGSANTNNNTYTLSDLPSGTYIITATTAENCTVTQTATLNNATSMLAVTPTPVNGICGELGSVTLLITGGTGPYLIEWTGPASGSVNTPATTYTISNLDAGTYTFTVTDANGCVQTATASVSVAEADLEVNATSITGICGQDGSIQVEISGGNPAYTIIWSGPESGSATISNAMYSIEGVPAGTYQISVTDAESCSETDTTILDVPEADLSIALTRINGICGQNGSVTVNITAGEAPFTISWTGAANGNTTTLDNSFTIADAPPGDYFILVTDDNGCTDSGTITVSSTPGVSAAAVAVNGTCGLQGSIIVNLIGGVGPYTIEWTGAASGSTTTANTTFTLSNLGSGTYNFTVTDANDCTATTTAILNNTGVPFGINAFPYHGFCGELGFIRVNMLGGTGPYLITWTGPVSGSASTAAMSYDILNLPSGIYMISVTDAQGCDAMDVEMINNSDTGALIAEVSAINGTCGNLGSIWITILQGQGPFVITWTGPQSGTITTSSTDFDIVDLPSGSYTVTIRDFNLCVEDYTVVLINVPDNLDISLTANNNVCGEPGSITVNINGTAPPYLITWTGLFGSGSATTSNSTFTIPNLQTGNYTVRVDDSAGCFEVRSQQVYNEAGVFTMTIIPNVGGCASQSSMQINISGGQAPYLLNWFGPSSNGTVSFSTSSYNLFGLPPGAYMVMVTDAFGCSKWQTVLIPPGNSPPVAAFSHTNNVLTVSFTNNSSPGVYLWNFGDGTTSTATNPVHTYAQDGTYNVCLTVTNGCGTTQYCKTIVVSVPSNIVILDVGENSGSAGTTILVPVRIRHCNLLTSVSGTFAVQNQSVGNITQLLPAAIAPQYNAGNKTFSRSGPAVALTENQILFYLVVQLTGSPGQSTAISLVNSPVAVAVGNPAILPHITFAGSASVSNNLQDDGELFTNGQSDVAMPEPEGEMNEVAGGHAIPDPEAVATMSPRNSDHPDNGKGEYFLYQNAPNPFTGNTVIAFDLPEAANADLIITDQLGRVLRIVRGNYPAGRNTVEFEGGTLDRGVYRYTLRTAGFSATRTMVLVK